MTPTLLLDNDFIDIDASLESNDLQLSTSLLFSNLINYEFLGDSLTELKFITVNILSIPNVMELVIEIDDIALFFSEYYVSSYTFNLDIPKNLNKININISIIDNQNRLYKSTLIINGNSSNKYLKTI